MHSVQLDIMPIVFLMNIAALAASALLIRRYFASESLHYRLLALSVFFYAQIVLVELFWGILGKLYLGNTVLYVFIIFFICYFLYRQGSASLTKPSLEVQEFSPNKPVRQWFGFPYSQSHKTII